MRTAPFGPTGVELPVIGQGSWDIPERGARAKEAQRALRRGIELGMTHLDTAEMYGSGAVEALLGQAISGLAREQLFITSKVLPSNATYAGTIAACERSLHRLGLEYLDLYLLHWPSSYPLEETMRALEALVEQGKVRYVGVSNFDLDDMLEARGYLRSEPLACNQVLYHLNERGIERRILPAAKRHDIAIVGYTPFGRGEFPKEAVAPDGVLGKIANKHGVGARAIILAFLTRDPAVFTIPKAARTEHVEENARGGFVQLDATDIEAIETAFPVGDDGPLATI
ncbi:MAG: aldo/keto reductase [Vulcanimicrobiaceae bacterium]